jgi:hypothetical protein
VAAAAARAEELQKAATAPKEGDSEEPPAELSNGKDPAAEPPKGEHDASSAEGAAVPTPLTGEKKSPSEEESWEHRYKSMKGRYDREVPELKSQIAAMGDEIRSLQNVLATMETKSAPGVSSKEIERLITPEEEEQYGTDFLTVVGKRATEIANQKTSELRAELDALKENLKGVANVTARTAQEKMYETLDVRVPKWREINRDGEFMEWLQKMDPFSGQIRQDMLTSAHQRNDAARVAAFFEGFLREAATVAPRADEPGTDRGNPDKPSLNDFAAPGRARSAAPKIPGPDDQQIITRAFISQFYVDKAAGRFRGREDEANKIERSIFDAQREGRIR